MQRIQKNLMNPNAATIIKSLTLAYEDNSQPVTFQMEDDKLGAVDVNFTGVKYESGKPGMFLIEGFMSVGGQPETKVEGFYNANMRCGWLENAS